MDFQWSNTNRDDGTKDKHQRSKSPVDRQTRRQTLANFNGSIYNILRARFKDGSTQQNLAEESFPTLGRLEMELRVDQ